MKRKKSKDLVVRPEVDARTTEQTRRVRALINKGWTASDIANKLAPGDDRKQKQIRTRVRSIIANDEEVKSMKALEAQGILIESTPQIVEAVVRRASKGNIPAAKLALEASGFHNPRVQHEHSGDIAHYYQECPQACPY
jgi:hypothetical protein